MNDVLPAYGSILARVTILIGSGLVVAILLQRRRPLVASSVLSATTVGLLLLPLLTALVAGCVVPAWTLPEVEVTNRLAEMLRGIPSGNFARIESDLDVAGNSGRKEPSPGTVVSRERTSLDDSDGDRAQFQPAMSDAPGPTPSTGEPSWMWIVASLYLTGVAILFTRLINSLRFLNELRRTALPLHGDWGARLFHWQECLGVNRRVELVASSAVTVPMTVGWLRPVILVPASMQSASLQHQDAILLHELAHIRRSDYAHLILLQLAQVIYWWHPLTWFIGTLGRQLCERACDELCVHWIGSRASY